MELFIYLVMFEKTKEMNSVHNNAVVMSVLSHPC